ncbi:hypothetical protein [Flavobacterium sp. SM2513]|uniref:hypothetical protein n=1 Tax=Flavobacterium sp. SM2513 TaxID=3424766 RepID=UPI003D7FD2DA
MKATSILSKAPIFNFVFISLATVGLVFSAVNHFLLQKPNTQLLILMSCLFVASVAAWFRNKLNK